MAQGQPGADSSTPVTTALIQSTTDFFGTAPVFWGRYFTSVNTTGSVEYRHSTENGPLNAAGIKLLPIARQTNNVGGTQQQGVADGAANAQDFITTFGVNVLTDQGGQFYIFLDVEASPSLSADYYDGWTQGLAEEAANLSGGSVEILPCIYCGQAQTASWTALQAATQAGAPCHGVWIARYYTGQCAMGDWLTNIVTPTSPSPFPWPILAWQYAENCNNGAIDCSQTNPSIDIDSQLLNFLVLPPA